ncbi:MAG: virulence factor [Candidatus Rokuibacteriota bacterium]
MYDLTFRPREETRAIATYQLVTWKDIPALVEARDDAGTVTRPLSERFQMLIDSVAMQLGLEGSEAYVALWGRSAPEERPGSAADVADAVAGEIESRFPTYIGTALQRPAS